MKSFVCKRNFKYCHMPFVVLSLVAKHRPFAQIGMQYSGTESLSCARIQWQRSTVLSLDRYAGMLS